MNSEKRLSPRHSGLPQWRALRLQTLEQFSLGLRFVERIERITTADDAIARSGGAIAEGPANQLARRLLARERIARQFG